MSEGKSMSFGTNLRNLRLSRRLSQQDLGKALGVAQITVSSWERDIREPNFETCERIAAFFGVPRSRIILPDEEQADGNYATFIAHLLQNSPQHRILFDRSLRMTPQELDAVIGIVNQITRGRDGT